MDEAVSVGEIARSNILTVQDRRDGHLGLNNGFGLGEALVAWPGRI